MSYSPFQLEQLVLGMLLRYPNEAPAVILPYLTHSRFIYGANGALGRHDHSDIMQKIILVSQVSKKLPYPINIKPNLSADLGVYLDALVDMVPGRYRVHEFSAQALAGWANEVDRNGRVYITALKAVPLSDIISNEDSFVKYVSELGDKDVDTWASDVLRQFASTASPDRASYQSTAALVPTVIDIWHRQRSGEQLALLDCGIPVLTANGFWPLSEFVVVHGMSGGAKSALVHQVNLGAAITLYVNGVQGCVAINSLEMSYPKIISRYAALLAGFDMTRLQQNPQSVSNEDMARLEEWAWFVSNLPLYIDDTNLIKTSAVEYRLNSLHNTEVGPVWQLSMDYLGLLDDVDTDNTEEKYANAAREMLRISRTIHANVIGISQSTYSDTKHYVAGLLGMRYSKGITHAADKAAEIWNPIAMRRAGMNYSIPTGVTNDQQMWMQVQKDRNGGFLGWIPLGWEPEYTRVFDTGLDTLSGQPVIFHHLNEAVKMMKNHHKATVPAVEDTYLGGFS